MTGGNGSGRCMICDVPLAAGADPDAARWRDAYDTRLPG